MSFAAPDMREQRILRLWECAAGLSRWAREDALLSSAGCVSNRLGVRNTEVLALRSALFGRAWPLKSACPECGTECAFEADSFELARELRALPFTEQGAVDFGEESIRLRAATTDDVRETAAARDPDEAARVLLTRCVADAPTRAWDADEMARLSEELERLDPAAMVSFAMSCPSCAHGWSASIDVAEVFWAELQRAAERLFLEVDALARVYGWTENEILGLPPIRRAAYLQLAGSA